MYDDFQAWEYSMLAYLGEMCREESGSWADLHLSATLNGRLWCQCKFTALYNSVYFIHRNKRCGYQKSWWYGYTPSHSAIIGMHRGLKLFRMCTWTFLIPRPVLAVLQQFPIVMRITAGIVFFQTKHQPTTTSIPMCWPVTADIYISNVYILHIHMFIAFPG